MTSTNLVPVAVDVETKTNPTSQVEMGMLCTLLSMTDREMYPYIKSLLADKYDFVEDRDEMYLVCVPQERFTIHPIALVSHIDTVRHHDRVELLHHLASNALFNKHGVLGADDRAGVYANLQLVLDREHGPMPIVIFPNEEEVGGIGVKQLISDGALSPWLDQIKLFIELDRLGIDQYVYYYHVLPKSLKTWVENFGYEADHGSYSDVADLTNAYGIPHFNLSVGYYDQHTSNERLCLDGLQFCLARMGRVLDFPIASLPEETITRYVPKYSPRWETRGRGYAHLGQGVGDNLVDMEEEDEFIGEPQPLGTKEYACAECFNALGPEDLWLCVDCRRTLAVEYGEDVEDVEGELITCLHCNNITLEEMQGLCAPCVEALCAPVLLEMDQ